MRKDRDLAIKLRKNGASYSEIEKELGIPKSTMGYWFKREGWSEKIKDALTKRNNVISRQRMMTYIKERNERLDNFYKICRKNARQEFFKLKTHPLFVSGLMLYWGEGDKKIKNGKVRLSNSDPKMLALFYKFLTQFSLSSKEKIKIQLILYPDINECTCKKFWSQIVKLPESQFIKASFIKGKDPIKKITNGVGIMYVNDRGLKEKVLTWINLIQREFNI